MGNSTEHDCIKDGKVATAAPLRDIRYVPCSLTRTKGVYGLPVEKDLTTVRSEHPGQAPEQGCFPCSVWTEDCRNPGCIETQAYPPENGMGLYRNAEMLGAQIHRVYPLIRR